MPAKTVAEEFELWVRATQSPAIGDVQLTEIRRAFYSGAFMTIGRVSEIAGAAATEDDGAAEIEKLWKECEQFFKDVGDGKA